MVGANGGSTVVPKARKNDFFQTCSHTTWDAQTSVFLAVLSPWWHVLGEWQLPKCLENGPFQDQKWVKNTFFQKWS